MKMHFKKEDLGLLLKKYKYWGVYLSHKQYYLGKLKIVLNRKGVIDVCELKKSEVQELFKIIKIYRRALVKCFKPDLFNYATLGNWTRHHHWHVIPRYKSKRKVDGVIFKDGRWNNPSWPAPKKKVSGKTLEVIRDLILGEV